MRRISSSDSLRSRRRVAEVGLLPADLVPLLALLGLARLLLRDALLDQLLLLRPQLARERVEPVERAVELVLRALAHRAADARFALPRLGVLRVRPIPVDPELGRVARVDEAGHADVLHEAVVRSNPHLVPAVPVAERPGLQPHRPAALLFELVRRPALHFHPPQNAQARSSCRSPSRRAPGRMVVDAVADRERSRRQPALRRAAQQLRSHFETHRAATVTDATRTASVIRPPSDVCPEGLDRV